MKGSFTKYVSCTRYIVTDDNNVLPEDKYMDFSTTDDVSLKDVLFMVMAYRSKQVNFVKTIDFIIWDFENGLNKDINLEMSFEEAICKIQKGVPSPSQRDEQKTVLLVGFY